MFDNVMDNNNFVFHLLQNPYPTEKEKDSFCMLTNKTLLQVTIIETNNIFLVVTSFIRRLSTIILEMRLIVLLILLYAYTGKQLVH